MRFEEFDTLTTKLCKETGRLIMGYYQAPDLQVLSKADDSPVTAADRESETMIRDAIQTLYPEHGIIGEEYGPLKPSAEYQWAVDPIDGTKTFAAATPLFGTLIALLKDGEPLYGCMNFPAIGKRLSGDNHRAYCNGDPISSRQGVSLDKATVLTSDHLNVARHQDRRAFEELLSQTRLYRTWGDCFGYYLVACGKADIMLDPIMNPWDIMALIPVIRGAGATITDWHGGNPARGASCIAANADLHESVLRTLQA